MRGRSTAELIVLMLTGTVCLSILLFGLYLAILKITAPATDTSAAVQGLLTLVSTTLGALLGLLMRGRLDRERQE